ncbi:MAG: HTH-type transcriptional activator RhaR [Chroococcidiopsis sp. SAG 2025]|uniref:AraC family transcriptional regulator n=1 Tax=Chroococcidiopsis sp. SAG 2025 TaxID=171389 RepID=UPI002936E4D5|nr:AraC family transcriptional regulator [Chroococcidiopsis sp. SAG 2025]MDV2992045.1 HTH-type transcriptional activator RhaR [Chroococcidiopsis sp. SAG 2025]
MQLANRVAIPLRTLTLPEQTPEQQRIIVFHSTGSSNSQLSRPHSHTFFELLFVEEGEGWYSIGDRHIWAKPGDLFLLAPGEVHDPSGLTDATTWVVGFSAEALNPGYAEADMLLMLPDRLLNSFVQTENAQTKHYYVPTEIRSRWLILLGQLKSELCDQGFGFTEATRALLILLLIETARLAASELPQSKKSLPQTRPIVKQVLCFIDANYCNSIGLQEVAKEVNLSAAYLTDMIRRETGKTVLSWIVERRMIEARRLLLETDLAVIQIAEAVGYCDAGYFNRLFRRLNGTTPQAWRVMYRG